MFKLEMATDNEAFSGDAARGEIARLLRETADKVEQGAGTLHKAGKLYDINGNPVGTWGGRGWL